MAELPVAKAGGDVIAVPAWTEFSLTADGQLDLFTFSDAPVFEKLNLLRTGNTENAGNAGPARGI